MGGIRIGIESSLYIQGGIGIGIQSKGFVLELELNRNRNLAGIAHHWSTFMRAGLSQYYTYTDCCNSTKMSGMCAIWHYSSKSMRIIQYTYHRVYNIHMHHIYR